MRCSPTRFEDMNGEHDPTFAAEALLAVVGGSRRTGGLPSLPEPEEELRPGTAMVSSRPEGEVAPITGDKPMRKREQGKGDEDGERRRQRPRQRQIEKD